MENLNSVYFGMQYIRIVIFFSFSKEAIITILIS